MGVSNRSFGLIRRAAMPALALIVIGNFAGYAVAGPNGLLAWGGYHRDLTQRRVELIRSCSTRARPTPTWPTNWSAAILGWSGLTKSSSRWNSR
jgi:hypothetical protein